MVWSIVGFNAAFWQRMSPLTQRFSFSYSRDLKSIIQSYSKNSRRARRQIGREISRVSSARFVCVRNLLSRDIFS